MRQFRVLAGAAAVVAVSLTLPWALHALGGLLPQDRLRDAAGLQPLSDRAAGFAVSDAVRDFPTGPSVLHTYPKAPGRLIRLREAAPGMESSGDGALQTVASDLIPTPSLSFDGLSNQDNFNVFGTRVSPPDTNGDVGPNHYVQATNSLLRVFSKNGAAVTAPFKMSSLFAALGGICSTTDRGDPVVLYDPLADRWLVSQFAFTSSSTPPFHQCIGISTSPDPTGTYFLYDFIVPNTRDGLSNFNDYPKFGVWSDAYYMSDNQFNGSAFTGAAAFAFDRVKMLAGNPAATYIYFNPGASYSGMLPSDVDGSTPPPAGAPNYFAMIAATEFGDPNDAIRVFSFHADFANPSASTWTERPESPLVVASFDPRTPTGRNDIEQPSPAASSSYLDAIQDRLMHRMAYRNFGGTRESLVVTHTVNVGLSPTTTAGHQAAVRYYELRRSLPGGSFTVPEQATFAPDTNNRWMGSAAMDSAGNIGVGYSVSSLTTFPAVRYAGRLVTDPANGLFQGEGVLAAGSGVQTSTGGRWGDYSSLSVDPSDDCTFWFTSEYYTAASQATSPVGWLTRIGTFKFPNCGPSATSGAELVTNGNFTGGTTGWLQWEAPNIVSGVVGGVFQFFQATPPVGSGQATVFQQTHQSVASNAPLLASFDLGNSGTARKRVSVLLADGDFSDVALCTFWLPAAQALKTYTMRAHTTKSWANASIYFYAATTGASGGNYLIDNVSLKYVASQTSVGTECLDPNVPAPPGGAPSVELLTNGTFGTGLLTPWTTAGTITTQIASGVLEFIRATATLPAGSVLQSTAAAMSANQIVTATFQLGNSSTARKRVTVLLHDADFSDLAACTFWLPPGQALSSYTMRAYATQAWVNATMSIYPATIGAEQWMRLDNASLTRTPASTALGTECLEPAIVFPLAVVGATPSTAVARPAASANAAGRTASPAGSPATRTAPAPATSRSAPVEPRAGRTPLAVDPPFHSFGVDWSVEASVTRREVLQNRDAIDLTSAGQATLSFGSLLQAGASTAEVQVSLDGMTWVTIAGVPPSAGWTTMDVDLSAFLGQIVYVQFVFDAVAPATGVAADRWQLGDISVTIGKGG